MNPHENNKLLKPVPKGFHYLKIDKMKYKIVVYDPIEKGVRRTKTLTTRDLATAMQQTVTFVDEIKKATENSVKEKAKSQEVQPLPNNLTDAISRWIGYLNGDPEIVLDYEFKAKSKKHLNDCVRYTKYLVLSLKGFEDVTKLPVVAINKNHIDKYVKYLQKLSLSPSSFNKGITILKSFYNYLIKEGYPIIRNPFNSVRREQVVTNNETFSHEQFKLISEAVQNEKLGEYKIKNNRPKTDRPKKDEYVKSWYKVWMKDSLDLGLLTGRRNFEIVSMKWNDIFKDENGDLLYIRVPDIKVNNQKGNDIGNLKYVYVPVTSELREVLYRLGYEQYQNTSSYILAPNEKMTRENINFFISKSFRHYAQQVNFDKKLSFKNLRKTYISQLSSMVGIENARIISGHSGIEIMKNNYIDKRMIALTARNLTMLGDDKANRGEELNNIRSSKPENQLER